MCSDEIFIVRLMGSSCGAFSCDNICNVTDIFQKETTNSVSAKRLAENVSSIQKSAKEGRSVNLFCISQKIKRKNTRSGVLNKWPKSMLWGHTLGVRGWFCRPERPWKAGEMGCQEPAEVHRGEVQSPTRGEDQPQAPGGTGGAQAGGDADDFQQFPLGLSRSVMCQRTALHGRCIDEMTLPQIRCFL